MKNTIQEPQDVNIKIKTVGVFTGRESKAMRKAGVEASAAAVARSYHTSGYISYIKDGVVVKKYSDGTIEPVKQHS